MKHVWTCLLAMLGLALAWSWSQDERHGAMATAASSSAAAASEPHAPAGTSYWLVLSGPAGERIADARFRPLGDWDGLHATEERVRGAWELTLGPAPASIARAVSQRRCLLVEAPGWAPRMVVLRPGHASPDHPHALELLPGATLEAAILDEEGGPVAQALVRLSIEADDLLGRDELPPAARTQVLRADWLTGRMLREQDGRSLHEWSASTDAEGRVAFVDLPPALPLRVDIEAHGRLHEIARKVALADGGERRTFVLPAEGALAGRAVDREGRPLPGVLLWAKPSQDPLDSVYFSPADSTRNKTVTGADGNFRFEGLPAGRYLVGPAPKGEEQGPGPAVPAFAVRVDTSNPGTEELLLTLDLDLFLRGIVLGPDGNVLAGAQVLALPGASGGTLQALTALDGTFRIGPVQRGAFELRATDDACACAAEPRQVSTGDGEVLLEVLETGTLAVRVERPADEPAFEVEEVVLEAVGTGIIVDRPARPEPDRFLLAGLRAGAYDVNARSTDGRMAVARGVQVHAGAEATECVLALVPTAHVELSNADPEVAQTVVFKDPRAVVVAIAVLAPGSRTGSIVPAGALRLERTGALGGFTRDVVLAPGEQARIEVDALP